MRTEKSKTQRNDFSEHDFQMITDHSQIVGQNQDLQQNSLFSSIQGPNTSISANNSIQITLGDSRLNNQKTASHGEVDETIGGSTAYPGAYDSINSAMVGQNSHLSKPSARGKK